MIRTSFHSGALSVNMRGLITSFGAFHLLLYICSGNARKVPENADSPVFSFLEMNGKTSESVMLTDTTGSHSISVVGVVPSCTLRFLAVGGGGKGTCGGGGSGYVQYQSVQVSSGTEISAEVGNFGEPSTVVINGKSTVANQGQDHQSWEGGNGYSGGGDGSAGNNIYEGGTDGGDGGGSHGGSGTGEDITAYDLSSWKLTPGAGGVGYGSCNCGCSGGGGGVMVDGSGPSAIDEKGQGYGGGGSGSNTGNNEYGLQGIILLEITSG